MYIDHVICQALEKNYMIIKRGEDDACGGGGGVGEEEEDKLTRKKERGWWWWWSLLWAGQSKMDKIFSYFVLIQSDL